MTAFVEEVYPGAVLNSAGEDSVVEDGPVVEVAPNSVELAWRAHMRGEMSVAEIVRRRREQLGWSQSELARRSGVSRFAVNEIEAAKRTPSVRTYEKLRHALGLDASAAEALIPTAPPTEFAERHLVTLAACLLSRRSVDLADIAEALSISIPAVREGVLAMRERLARCGFATVDDGVRVELVVLPYAATAVARVSELEVAHELSQEALEVLLIVGHMGEATRRQVDERRLQDSAGLLDRLVRRGLLDKRSEEDQLGQPNAYRLTTRALAMVGHATLESFQAWCQEQMARAGGMVSTASSPGRDGALRE